MPWFAGIAALFCAIALYIGFAVAPRDPLQGEYYRIAFLHTPATWVSTLIYFMMATAAGIGLVKRHRIASMAACALAPTGAMFAFLALWTGSLLGKPHWGIWWVWDARLTAELLELFLFLGFIALQEAIEDSRRADRASGLLAMVGLCGLPILYFSILWWSARQATQPLDLHLAPEVATILLPGMLAMTLGLFSYTIAAGLTRLRIVILERERNSDWVARRFGEHG